MIKQAKRSFFSNLAFSVITTQSKALRGNPNSPSLAEGALRSFPTSQSICHTEGVARSISTKGNGDSSLNATHFAQNDNKLLCHLKRSEVSQKQNRDISLDAQYDKVDISVSKKPQYDNANATHATTPSKSKRLALSLATASILAGAALDIAAAQCGWSIDWSHGGDVGNVGYAGKVDCTGVSNNIDQFLKNGDGYNRPTYYRSNYWNLSGSTSESSVTTTFDTSKWNTPTSSIASVRNFDKRNVYQEVNFNGFNGSSTSFTFQSGSSDSNPSTNYNRVRINVNAGTRLKELTLTGNFADDWRTLNNGGVYITNSTINTKLETKTGTIPNLNISGSSITNYTSTSGNVKNLNISSGSNIGTISISGTVGTLNIDGGSRIGNKLSGSGRIGVLNLGARNQEGSASIADTDFSGSTIGQLNILSYSLQLGNTTGTTLSNGQGQIKVNNAIVGVATAGITVTRKRRAIP